jgi:hypothetical protein
MWLTVNFSKEDKGNNRVYYKGMGNQHGHTYCLQEGVWYGCFRDGELDKPLKDGLELTIYDESGIIEKTIINKSSLKKSF